MKDIGAGSQSAIENAREKLLQFLIACFYALDLDDKFRDDLLGMQHLQGTPQRVAEAFTECYLSGYTQTPHDVLTTEFAEKDYDEIVLLKNIPFYSLCAHHLVPFFGTAAIAYIPKGKVVGLSKLGRLVEIYARRLQVQEQMTREIACALRDVLMPLGVAVVVEAEHLCMSSRGLSKPGIKTLTSYMLGCFRDEPEARAEVLALIRS
jgi:GTP cyclohydrolase IA